MQNEFANRQNMHLTVLNLLENPAYQSAWQSQKPAAFATRAALFAPQVRALTDLIGAQQAATTGFAQAKDREEQDLEHTAHEISQILSDWYEESGREGDAAQIDLPLSAWQRLRDTELIAKSHLLQQKLSAALASHPAELADYDLTPADATHLAKETADFELLTADPSAAISRRKSLTVALRPAFREVAILLDKMDRLVLRFRRTELGTSFANAWDASRTIRDLGGSTPEEPVVPAV